MPIHELAALGAALCWAVTGLISHGISSRLGPFGFNFYRQGLVTLMLALIVLAIGGWRTLGAEQLPALIWSGIIGIFLGDTALFLALNRMGPRRTGAMFSLNAPIAAVLGWLFLGEQLSAIAVAGIVLSALGVGIAVLGRPGRSGSHAYEAIRGPVWLALIFGLLAALGQALGSLIARPVMASGVEPFTGSLIRVAVAFACLGALTRLPLPILKPQARLTPRLIGMLILSGFVAMVVGMTLLLFALQGGEVGIVSTLSATSPVVILPMLWLVTGARPSATSWAGALLAVIGMALIFLR